MFKTLLRNSNKVKTEDKDVKKWSAREWLNEFKKESTWEEREIAVGLENGEYYKEIKTERVAGKSKGVK